MNFIFLKYFYDTVKRSSVTAAALENHVTQSAISQGISQLEKLLSVSLLTHKRNSIKVTSEGALVFERSKTIFREIEKLKLVDLKLFNVAYLRLKAPAVERSKTGQYNNMNPFLIASTPGL